MKPRIKKMTREFWTCASRYDAWGVPGGPFGLGRTPQAAYQDYIFQLCRQFGKAAV